MPNDIDSVMREIAAVMVADPPEPPEWPLDDAVVSTDAGNRRWPLPAAAAAAIVGLVIGGLWLISSRIDDEQAPATIPEPNLSATELPVRPDRYPVVGDPGQADLSSAGQYSQRSTPGGPQVIALLAKRAGNSLIDGVRVTAGTSDDESLPGPGEPITVWGQMATLHVENGTPVQSTVIVPQGEGYALSFFGRDPMALIEQLEPDTVRIDHDTPMGPDVPFALTFGQLPAGFEVVAGPQAIAAQTLAASLRIGNDGEPGFAFVELTVSDPIFDTGAAADLVAVDINGTPGWMRPDSGFSTSWSVGENTFVMVGGLNSADDALDFARRLTFVDETTWQARYGVPEPSFPDRTPTCPATVATEARALRLAPAAIPAGMFLASCEFEVRPAGDPVVDRIYAAATSTPENGPAFVLTTLDARYVAPDIPGDAEVVTVQGVDAWLSPGTAPSSLTVSVGPIDGLRYRLTGYHVTRDDLLAAANGVQPAQDGYGATLDHAALPAEVSEIAAGVRFELWFLGRDARQDRVGRATWTDGGQRYLWYMTTLEPGTDLAANRIGFDIVTDITVDDHPGYHATLGEFHTIAWSDGEVTVLLGGRGFTSDELETIAESMHEASQLEWADLVASMPLRIVDNAAPAGTLVD